MLAEFTVEGTPASSQASGRTKLAWKNEVYAAAATVWPKASDPVTDPVKIIVVYYYIGSPLDVDNMLKPIQDALNGLIYQDDGQITDTHGSKRALDGSFRVRGMSPVLAEAFCHGGEFVHIRVEQAPDPQDLV
jgi:hypothetical protein